MRQHQILPSEAAPESCRASGRVQNPPVEESRHTALIEDYLDHFCAPLVGTVPYARRQELRRELTAHLESLIDALEEVGATRDEAVLDALLRFGDPRKLGAQWAYEWQQGTPERLTPWAPMRVTLAVYGGLSLGLGWLLSDSGASSGLLMLLLATILPAVVGLSVGLKVRGRSALGTIYGIFPLAVLTGLLFLFCSPLDDQNERLVLNVVGGLVVIQSMCWLPIGTAFAALGSWLRRRVVWLPPRLALK